MTVYVALLRGINVGGHRKVAMPLLRQMFETIGFGRVRTYINSGNVIFDAEDGAEADRELAGRIEREIETTFGFPVDVMVRSAADLARAIAANPYANAGAPADLHLHIGFMRGAPDPQALDKLAPFVNEQDEFRVIGREIYAIFRSGVRDSKLAGQLSRLGVPVTLRNWNTTCKLAEMAAN